MKALGTEGNETAKEEIKKVQYEQHKQIRRPQII